MVGGGGGGGGGLKPSKAPNPKLPKPQLIDPKPQTLNPKP